MGNFSYSLSLGWTKFWCWHSSTDHLGCQWQIGPKVRFSSWQSLARIIARLLHATNSSKQSSSCKSWHIHESPCPKEDQAWSIIVHAVQQDSFKETFKCIREGTVISKRSPLYSLCPYVDTYGLLRIGGCLSKASVDKDAISLRFFPGRVTSLLFLTFDHIHGGDLGYCQCSPLGFCIHRPRLSS